MRTPALCSILLCAALCRAATGGEVVVANIASRGFDLLLRTPAPPAASQLALFLDAGGTQPAAALTVERQPLFTGATEGDDYARRCADRLTRQAMTDAGNTLFRVANADPDTPYFARLSFDGADWPETGLHEIRTLPSGAWRTTTHQILVDIHRPGNGWVATLAVPGAASPLLAVCGDGAPTNSCLFFNLADLADSGGAPLTPEENAPMTLSLYGNAGSPATQRTLAYAPPSASAAAVASLSTEVAPLLRLLIASAVQSAAEPAAGENFFFSGHTVTCRLAQTVVTQIDTQFVAYGWSGSGNVPVSGRTTSFTFALTADSTLAWSWRTNFWLEVVADHGSVDLASGWYRSGASLAAAALPAAEWYFSRWSGLGQGTEPLTAFTVTSPGQLRAEFEPVLVPGGGGMPEWWLTQAGLTGAARDPDADPDKDGMSNRLEWLADTSPTNRASDLRITDLAKAGSLFHLTWRGGREARQVVEMLEGDLSNGIWRPVATNLPPTDTVGTCAIQIEGRPKLFFRIKAER